MSETNTPPAATPTPQPAANPAVAPQPTTTAAAAPAEEHKAPKVKVRKPRQRACDEKDEKGKLCCGHLKRWYDYPREVEALVGKKAEIYRCEFCKTIYTPNMAEMPQSYTLRT